MLNSRSAVTDAAPPNPSRKTPRQRRSQALVDALLDATARVLAARPLAEVTTNEIAEVAGVSVGSLYQYFRDKRGLAAALIERKAERDGVAIVAALDGAGELPFDAAVATLVRATVDLHRRDARLMRALLTLVGPTGRSEAVREIAARALAVVMARLAPHAEALRETDLALAGFIVGRALEEVVHAAVVERPDVLEHPRFVDELTHLVVAYLRRP